MQAAAPGLKTFANVNWHGRFIPRAFQTAHQLVRASNAGLRPAGLRSYPVAPQVGGPCIENWGSVHMLACCTEYRQETAILQRSASRNGFAFHAVGVGQPWQGFATKFLAYSSALQYLLHAEIQPYDMVQTWT